jgi:hypothetical protein
MSSFYCSRSLALDFIYAKTGNSYEHRSNIQLDSYLEQIVNNPDYSFLIIDDEDIDYMPRTRTLITEHSLNYICKL